jgi:surface antigen
MNAAPRAYNAAAMQEATMRKALGLSSVLVLTACTYHYYPAPTAAPVQPQTQAQAQPSADCREFTANVTIGGLPQQATGQACRQPDGSWRIK